MDGMVVKACHTALQTYDWIWNQFRPSWRLNQLNKTSSSPAIDYLSFTGNYKLNVSTAALLLDRFVTFL